MNPVPFTRLRSVIKVVLVVALILVAALASVGVPGSSEQNGNTAPPHESHSFLASIGVHATQLKDDLAEQYRSYFQKHDEHRAKRAEIVVTSPRVMDVTVTQRFVCQIHSRQHIDVCALDSGYLEKISFTEGQAVKKGDVMFELLPVLYSTKAAAESAAARVAQMEYEFSEGLQEKKVISKNELRLLEAKRDNAKAKAEMVNAELSFTKVIAPFDGVVDRQRKQLGSLIHEGDVLTTLSDNSVMWVYFNVPEKWYLEYMSNQDNRNQQIELELANHDKFPQSCIKLTVEGQFNNQTGNIAFRADFPNPDGVLRHGQTGTILIHKTLEKALVIPQRATFDLLDKRYVWVIGADDAAHQRLITVEHELEDVFVIASGLEVGDKIVFEGIREVEEGRKVEYEFRKPEEVLENQKFHAE